jgi:uncharacterized protein (DUF433 family)
MVVNDLHIAGISAREAITQTPLISHPNATLPLMTSVEVLQAVRRRYAQVVNTCGNVEQQKAITKSRNCWPALASRHIAKPSWQIEPALPDYVKEIDGVLRSMIAIQSSLALERETPPLHQDASGVIRVGQTRVTLESVISLFEQGASAEEIALRYDVLDLHDIYATLSYYLGHRQQTNEYLNRVRQASVGARRDAERRSPAAQIRERLERHRTRTNDQPAG